MSATRTSTGSSAKTLYFEDGEQVYPCRCGETHRGDYAAYDWHHHNCFHDKPLHRVLGEVLDEGFLLCPQCGEGFYDGEAAFS